MLFYCYVQFDEQSIDRYSSILYRLCRNTDQCGQSPIDISDITPGSYLIEVSAEGYASFSRWIDVQHGRTIISIELRRLGAHINIGTTPADLAHSTIEIRGKGSYEPGMFLPEGEYTLYLKAFGSRQIQYTFSITDGSDKVVDLELERTDFTVQSAELARNSIGMHDWSSLAHNQIFIEAPAPGATTIHTYVAQQLQQQAATAAVSRSRQVLLIFSPA